MPSLKDLLASPKKANDRRKEKQREEEREAFKRSISQPKNADYDRVANIGAVPPRQAPAAPTYRAPAQASGSSSTVKASGSATHDLAALQSAVPMYMQEKDIFNDKSKGKASAEFEAAINKQAADAALKLKMDLSRKDHIRDYDRSKSSDQARYSSFYDREKETLLQQQAAHRQQQDAARRAAEQQARHTRQPTQQLGRLNIPAAGQGPPGSGRSPVSPLSPSGGTWLESEVRTPVSPISTYSGSTSHHYTQAGPSTQGQNYYYASQGGAPAQGYYTAQGSSQGSHPSSSRKEPKRSSKGGRH